VPRSPAPPLETADLTGRTALVLGLGRWSGGVETVKFLHRAGAHALVSDTADPASLAASLAAIADTGATTLFGPQTPALLDRLPADGFVVAGPAIPFDHPVLVEASRRGVAVTTEIALFTARVRAPVLGVTGTKGKSTTSTLLAAMLTAAGRTTHLGGNVGRSLLNDLDAIGPDDAVVLELSSFQLHGLARTGFRPAVAVVTNLFPDHLDRHGTMAHYAASKRALLDAQTAADAAVLPWRDATLDGFGFRTAGAGRRLFFDTAPFVGDGVYVTEAGDLADARGAGGTDLAAFRLWGRHNRGNAAAAAAAARAFGATWAEVRAGAASVRPLPHRLEPVHEAGGILFVDDSIATTPQSTAAALEAVPRRCVVLVGGKDKGPGKGDAAPVDLTPLLDAVVARARAVVGIGTTGPALVAAAAARGVTAVAAASAPDLLAAVRAAVGLAAPGDAILLSPGFSSLDQFASFAVRGDAFAAAARTVVPA